MQVIQPVSMRSVGTFSNHELIRQHRWLQLQTLSRDICITAFSILRVWVSQKAQLHALGTV